MKRGYLRIGSLNGAPILVHVLTPLVPLVFSGFHFDPGLFVGYFVVLLVHELGHALVAWRRGLGVQRIELDPLGGRCVHVAATDLDEAAIAWGGVLAQAWLYVAALAWTRWHPSIDAFALSLAATLLTWNLVIAGINLIPFPPLDGAKAFRLFPLLGWFRRGPAVAPLVDPEEAARDAAVLVATALERAREEARR